MYAAFGVSVSSQIEAAFSQNMGATIGSIVSGIAVLRISKLTISGESSPNVHTQVGFQLAGTFIQISLPPSSTFQAGGGRHSKVHPIRTFVENFMYMERRWWQ